MKKLFSLLLVLTMLTGMMTMIPFSAAEATPAIGAPEGTPIATVEEFINMDPTGTYYLANDLDFENVNYDSGHIAPNEFSGVFDGQGHSLLGVKIESASDTGVFGIKFHGTLKNLTVGSADALAQIACTDSGKASGAVVASLENGDSTFENVTVYANHLGGNNKAGMFGGFVGSGLTINFTDCETYGTVEGGPVGGFVATRQCDTPTLNFTNCANNATVSVAAVVNNATPVGGYYAVSWDYDSSNAHKLTFVNCVNNGTVNAIIGRNDRGSAAGFICGNKNVFDASFTGCVNNGTINGDNGASAGIIAIRGDGKTAEGTSVFTVTNCVNNGKIVSGGDEGSAAGIIAIPRRESNPVTFTVKNTINNGEISGRNGGAGGLVAVSTKQESGSGCVVNGTVIGSANLGTVSATDWRAGGVVGPFGFHNDSSLYVSYCYNTGTVNNPGQTACGIVGEIANSGDATQNRVITNCYNVGTLNGGGDNANEIAHSENWGLSSRLIVTNAFYIERGLKLGNWLDRFTIANSTGVADTATLLTALNACELDGEGYTYMADIYGINGGNPILSWQVPETVTAPDFSSGTIEGEGNAYTVSSDGITAFVSIRKTSETISDLRFILALDRVALASYETFSIKLEFGDEAGVIKTLDLSIEDLTFYASASGAGNTYTAASDDCLAGVIVTGVPNDAWDYAVLSVSTAADGTTTMAGVTTSSILN